MNNYGMLLMILLPILGGVIGFYLGKKNQETRNDWFDIIAVVELVLMGYLGYQIMAKGMTIELVLSDLLGLGLSLTLDFVRLLMCVVATIIFGTILQFMKESMKEEQGSNRFYMLFMSIFGCVLGAFMSNNLFNFMMFLVFAAFLAYPLMVHRQDRPAMKNGTIYSAFTVAGIVLMLTGLTIVFAYVGSVSYKGMYNTIMQNGGNTYILVGGIILTLGLAVFAGLFPLQLQVTRGSSYGLIEISAIISTVLTKLGIWGVLVLSADVFMGSGKYGDVLLALSLLTIIWGLLISLSSTDIRRILMGLDVSVNGFAVLSAALMVLCGESNTFAIRSAVYMLIVSSLSVFVLYMVALEQVRKINTYEIKGLIASGKGNKLLMVVCFIACATIAGAPGTIGFLAYSMMYKAIVTIIEWKWLVVLYILVWAFLMTAATRVFMKFFVSKKDETVRVLSEKEKEEEDAQEDGQAKNPYLFGEILLLVVGILQIVVGVIPGVTVDKVADSINAFFHGPDFIDALDYYTSDALIGLGIAVALAIVLYVNLVHGILLRAIKDKKTKKIQKDMEE